MRATDDEAAGPASRIAPRQWVVPAYLFACLMIGGSPQGVGFALTLQLGAIVLLVWALVLSRGGPAVRGERSLWALVALFGLLILLQLVPLPPGVWTRLPWRLTIAEGDALLGLGAVWRPWTLSRDATVGAALTALPPIAVLVAMIRARAYRADVLALAILAGTMVSILLGIKQRGDVAGAWNFYPIGNFGVATGTFANANFFGSLLLASVPLATALGVARARRTAGTTDWSLALPVLPILLFVLLGMVLNGSLAVALLAVPVILFSLSLAYGAGTIRIGRLALVAAVVLAVAASAVVLLGGGGHFDNTGSFAERRGILEGATALLTQVFPVGTGLGTFPTVYAMNQDPASITRFVVNHAHNDYVELVIEMGIGAVLLILAVFAWFAWQAGRVWRSTVSDVYARAGTIMAATLLVHSAVDYPLRTAAMAAVMAAGIGLMVVGNNRPSGERPNVRHVRLD